MNQGSLTPAQQIARDVFKKRGTGGLLRVSALPLILEAIEQRDKQCAEREKVLRNALKNLLAMCDKHCHIENSVFAAARAALTEPAQPGPRTPLEVLEEQSKVVIPGAPIIKVPRPVQPATTTDKERSDG